MLFLLSPAKSLDYATPVGKVPHTLPLFVKQSTVLIKLLVKKSPRQISKLMDLSDDLSKLNVARYKAWSPEFTIDNAKHLKEVDEFARKEAGGCKIVNQLKVEAPKK